ncbi:hypothetical protein BHY_1211 (plasmid) [Borrelia nietonii YOR]|uniref:Uncharacterized protein n=1 Tax=Borrelia nietonii YOR TaxID=1293576 RepID=W5SB26_9SPIR|nr:hypothetical protein BHY_1211 [Borrelia nietonii YOR]
MNKIFSTLVVSEFGTSVASRLKPEEVRKNRKG